MKIVFLLISVLFGFSSFALSQSTAKNSSEISLHICQPEITESGRQSSFQISYVYRLMSDENGSIIDIREFLDHEKYKHMMNDENVIPCMKTWKLKPLERYFVIINVGTTSEEKSLNIKSKTIKVTMLL